MGRRILIAAGTAKYDHLDEDQQRPQIDGVVAAVARLFTGQLGYERVLPEIGQDPTSSTLRTSLDDWFASPERDPDDWVVFYYTGHGELAGTNTLYLLTRDYRQGRLAGTAFPVSQLGDMLVSMDAAGENRRVTRFLLLLDTCFSGAGVVELTDKIRSQFSQGAHGGMFYVLGAALPNEEAMAGALAGALIDSLQDEALGGPQQERIYFDQLLPAIGRRLPTQRLLWSPVLSPTVEPEFFPNPRHVAGLPSSATVQEIRHAAEHGELSAFWDPVSRGVEFEQQAGWYFTGRERILDELAAWLVDPHDFQARIVTGPAGSGKSAILSRIVTLSEPGYRARMPAAAVGPGGHIPPGLLHLAVHARGKTLDEITGRIAQTLGVPGSRAAVLEALAARRGPFRLVLDALDEAREPTRIARELLVPLGATGRVKLLVGTRPELLDELGPARRLHVDDPRYLAAGELAEFVTARLLRRGLDTETTPYRGRDELARGVAAVVAEKAYPNFLIARLVSEDLLGLPGPAGPAEVRASGVPDTVNQAFARYLARFGGDEQRVRDLLAPLAWAEGLGLPWDHLWAPVASALSGRPYHDRDVAWLLRHAGSFVVESLEQERSVYRLYHQALADHLRHGRSPVALQRAFADALAASVPPLPEGRGRDWRLAAPYVRRHAAEHAAAGGTLGSVMADPLFLLTADPRRLLSTLASHGSAVPLGLVNVYRGIVHHVRDKPLDEAASYLEMSARQHGLDDLADHPSLRVVERRWRVPWTRWLPRAPSHALGAGESAVSALGAATLDGRPVALVGRDDGSAEAWDVADDTLLGRMRPEGAGFVRNVALARAGEGPLLVASWYSGELGVLDLASGQSWLRRTGGETFGLCVLERAGQVVCATAAEDLGLAIRALPSLEVLVERPHATPNAVYHLAPARRGEQTVLLSAGDSLETGRDATADSRLRLWSLDRLEPLWGDGRGERGVLKQSHEAVLRGRRLVATSQDAWGPAEVWDLDQGRRVFRDTVATRYAWLHASGYDALLVAEGLGRLRVHRLSWTEEDGAPALSAELVADRIPIQGGHFAGPVRLHGRTVLLSSAGNHVRVWDLDELLSRGDRASADESPAEALEVMSLAAGPAGREALFAGTFSEVVELDAATGAVRARRDLGRRARGPLEMPMAVRGLSLWPGRDRLVAGTANGAIHVLDLRGPRSPVRSVLAGRSLEALRTLRWQKRALAFVTVDQGRSWSVRVWDLPSGREVPTAARYQLTSGQEDKEMGGLAVARVGRTVRIAFASKYAKVMVGNLAGAETPSPYGYQEWYIPDAEGEYVPALAVGGDGLHLAAGTERGRLAVWDFGSGALHALRENAHLGEVRVVVFGTLEGREVLVSAGEDGTVRFWAPDLEPLRTIVVGEPITALAWTETNRLAAGTRRGILLLQLG